MNFAAKSSVREDIGISSIDGDNNLRIKYEGKQYYDKES